MSRGRGVGVPATELRSFGTPFQSRTQGCETSRFAAVAGPLVEGNRLKLAYSRENLLIRCQVSGLMIVPARSVACAMTHSRLTVGGKAQRIPCATIRPLQEEIKELFRPLGVLKPPFCALDRRVGARDELSPAVGCRVQPRASSDLSSSVC